MRPLEPIPERAVRPPRLNGRYVVTRLLGKGAQARVYLAFDARLRQWRALKVLAANYLEDEHIRGRFDQEAQAMARLSHPNLLRVSDIDADGRTPFIVMELARGGAVTDWLKRNGAMPARLACDVVRQTCEGLAHAHAAGVVHRDVKPHNLLIKDDGTVVLTDFGIAHMEEGMAMTQTGHVMGTFAFMAPEQRNDAKSVDGRADVYALGATLYTLLTLKTSAELFFAEARDEILAGIPEPLRDVIVRACKYDRDERLPSVQALAEAVSSALAKLPADPPGPSLTDAVKPLPEQPPEFLGEDSGVDDLQRALAIGSEEQPTYVQGAAGKVGHVLEESPTTLYSDTQYEEAATVLPYMMPKREANAPRASISELSEEDVPDYVDLSTLDRRPRRERFEVPKSPQVEAPAAEPAERSAWMAAGAAVAIGLMLILSLLGYGVFAKFSASSAVRSAESDLVEAANQYSTLVAELGALGADEQALRAAYFAIQDAPPGERGTRAVAYADQVAKEADRVSAQGIARTQANQLRSGARRWVESKARLDAARSSRLGRVTGDLGL